MPGAFAVAFAFRLFAGVAALGLIALIRTPESRQPMIKKSKLPVITLTCPACEREHHTLLLGVESAIYIPCDCGRVIGYYLIGETK